MVAGAPNPVEVLVAGAPNTFEAVVAGVPKVKVLDLFSVLPPAPKAKVLLAVVAGVVAGAVPKVG